MTPPTGVALTARVKAGRTPPTPEQRLARQERRMAWLRSVTLTLMIGTAVMLLGGVGLWVMLSLTGPAAPGPQETASETARSLLPLVRMATLYTLLLLLLTAFLRHAVDLRRPHAFALGLTLAAGLLFAFPFGTLLAPVVACLLPPRRWLDLRPHARA